MSRRRWPCATVTATRDVHAVIFPYNGWGGHPIESDHAEMAAILIDAILTAMPELASEIQER